MPNKENLHSVSNNKNIFDKNKKLNSLTFFYFDSWPKESGANFLNLGIRTRFLVLQPKTALIFAVEQLSFILEKESVKTLIKIEFYETEISSRLKEIKALQKRVWFNLYKFISST